MLTWKSGGIGVWYIGQSVEDFIWLIRVAFKGPELCFVVGHHRKDYGLEFKTLEAAKRFVDLAHKAD